MTTSILPPPSASAPIAPVSKMPKMANNKKDGKHVVPPPEFIVDREHQVEYTRHREIKKAYLGEGGFARVYQYTNHTARTEEAVKVIPHERVTSKAKRMKLWGEIQIHGMMDHPHIVRFNETFEDEQNVYLTLELCDAGNLMSLLKRRKSFTEPETRLYLTQLISGIQYMHKARVMHRDLKLGNVFVTRGERGRVELKIGDFGLAALLDRDSDRRQTMCGTPNYIAPEVLKEEGKKSGHSYEVDIWGLGVIMYTMLVGRPPFQGENVSGIYQNIKGLNYSFPEHSGLSREARGLIKSILTPDPKLRPTLNEILHHAWFTCGAFPSSIPVDYLSLDQTQIPNWGEMSREEIKANFTRAKRRAGVGADFPLRVPPARTVASLQQVKEETERAVREREREIAKAVQPGSPISALLRSARKPPVVAPVPAQQSSRGESGLLPQFQALQKQQQIPRGSPLRNEAGRAGPVQKTALAGNVEEEDIEDADEVERYDARAKLSKKVLSPSAGRTLNQAQSGRTGVTQHTVESKKVNRVRSASVTSPAKGKGKDTFYDRVAKNLTRAMEFRENKQEVEVPEHAPKRPRDFIACWLDYAHKYGMGYALTDGTVGVYFNDATSMVLSPNKQYIDRLEPLSDNSSSCMRKSIPVETEPTEKDVKDRKYLLHHFEAYMEGKLRAGEKYCVKDMKLDTGMTYMLRYWQLKPLLAFRMSSGVLQFNFQDHSKLVLSQEGLVVTYIDDAYNIWTWHLATLVGSETAQVADSREKRRMESAWRKVEYVRDVISKLDRAPRSSAQQGKANGKE